LHAAVYIRHFSVIESEVWAWGFVLGFFALNFSVLVASSWGLAADSHTDSSGPWCGSGAHQGSLLTLSLIEGWGEEKACLTLPVRPDVQRAMHVKQAKRADPCLRFGFLSPTPLWEARKR